MYMIYNIFQFIIAVIVAFLGQIYYSVASMIRTMNYVLRLKKIEYDLYKRRLNICSDCPLFFRPLRTCGTPLRFLTKNKRFGGCWCYMPFKAMNIDSECWLDENNLPGGWGEHNIDFI